MTLISRFGGALAVAVAASFATPASAQSASDDYAKAMALRSQGSWNAAIELLTQAMARSPGDADLVLGRGLAWYDKGLVVYAIADYDAALRLSPGLALAHAAKAVADARRGDHLSSRADAEKAVALAPQDGQVAAVLVYANKLAEEAASVARRTAPRIAGFDAPQDSVAVADFRAAKVRTGPHFDDFPDLTVSRLLGCVRAWVPGSSVEVSHRQDGVDQVRIAAERTVVGLEFRRRGDFAYLESVDVDGRDQWTQRPAAPFAPIGGFLSRIDASGKVVDCPVDARY